MTEWIRAKEVFDRAGLDAENAPLSPLAIAVCSNAKAGLAKSRCKKFVLDGHNSTGAFIEPKFWWAGGYGAQDQDWLSGNFSGPHGNPRARVAEAFGVEFALEDIDDLIQAYSIKKNLTDELAKEKGGAVKDDARWTLYWHTLIGLAQEGRLTLDQFPSGNALRAEIDELMGDAAFSEKTTKSKTSQVFKKFVRGG